jgi:hypothetical protein
VHLTPDETPDETPGENMNLSSVSSNELASEKVVLLSLSDLRGLTSSSSASGNIAEEVRAFRGQISSWAASYARRDPSTKSLGAESSLQDWSRHYFGVTIL